MAALGVVGRQDVDRVTDARRGGASVRDLVSYHHEPATDFLPRLRITFTIRANIGASRIHTRRTTGQTTRIRKLSRLPVTLRAPASIYGREATKGGRG